ncbi:MAG: thioredoxin family protein [Hyphomicrobiaceae bacterium]|nr:thioredoxin family protein [Hyphomicrobiaceae bacterium]
MIDRRTLLLGTGAAFTVAAHAGSITPAGAEAGAKLTDDGLHYEPWFQETFLDLKDDAAEARAQGKSLVLFFEQRGCPYCGEMHKANLSKPEIADYIKQNFYALQINLYGSRKVKDFDGQELEERKLAERWRVNFTPSLVFLPTDPAVYANKSGGDVELWRLMGYWKPFHFLGTFVYVHSGGYSTEPNFQQWLSEYREKLRAEGKDVSLW